MNENPYSAPTASTAVEHELQRIPLRIVAARGAKGGALIGMGIFGVLSVLVVVVVLVVAIRAEMRVDGGFRIAIERLADGKSILEMTGTFLAGLTVFGGWGAIIGTIARTLSEWSRQ
jgi:hypothetical protein